MDRYSAGGWYRVAGLGVAILFGGISTAGAASDSGNDFAGEPQYADRVSTVADLYARGRRALDRTTPQALAEAEKLFNDAIVADSFDGRGYAGLAEVWQVRGEAANDGRGEPAFYPRVVAHLKKALELTPGLAEAHASLGTAYASAWKFANGKAELEKALQLKPDYAQAHYGLARVLELDGRLGAAITSYRRAAELAPRSPRIANDQARALFLAGRWGEALTAQDRILAEQPDNAEARRWRAWSLVELERVPEAVAEAKRVAVGADAMDPVFAAAVFYRAGLRGEGDEAFKRIPASVRTTVQYLVAVTGRRDDAIALMAPAIGSPAELPLLYYMSAFDPLRNHPRFREILRAAGVNSAHRRAQEERAEWRDAKAKASGNGAGRGA